MTNRTIAEQRGYAVKSTIEAKQVAINYLNEFELLKSISFGLPEIDDRYHIWRVPLKNKLEEMGISRFRRTTAMPMRLIGSRRT